MAKTNQERRRFIKLSGFGLLAISQGGLFSKQAIAAEELSLDDPTAKALQYTHTSTVEGKNCANCQHIQGEEGQAWRPCALFPNKLVANEGWCAGWVAKVG
ncbi:high-potential iron sulfur protein 2 [Alginatibacterium sediminis]|uniref:High-potential iron-sulfur protein n=1 Tax=Alginatibacterium sediminis TaxID=2164068 RepID=A0A420E8K5_9ALTE|nr:high-potential iron-sulfur protein [Alginatibacterium sediminis]RKF15740.1 high-potential iron sulfur protein 2 [Alginatibacterium sediminis]